MPHRRKNLLTGEWVLVSPRRQTRPWHGETEAPAEATPTHDETCYLCPGNRRANGEVNPNYAGVFVFDNDYPALSDDSPADDSPGVESRFTQTQSVTGTCRVVCFSPRHDTTLSQLSAAEIATIVREWRAQFVQLIAQYEWVQIFENRGAMMGCSNAHPHGQIWASDFLPGELQREEREQRGYFATHGSALLDDYLRFELRAGERVVTRNSEWAAVLPYWAVWPFETLLLPLRPVRDFADLDDALCASLAEVLKALLMKYDALFNCAMPYCMGWHCAPAGGEKDAWRLHAHCYPPLRSATVKKFMVGYEMLAEAQRDLTAEEAAARF